jgi:hypothetical protein
MQSQRYAYFWGFQEDSCEGLQNTLYAVAILWQFGRTSEWKCWMFEHLLPETRQDFGAPVMPPTTG